MQVVVSDAFCTQGRRVTGYVHRLTRWKCYTLGTFWQDKLINSNGPSMSIKMYVSHILP